MAQLSHRIETYSKALLTFQSSIELHDNYKKNMRKPVEPQEEALLLATRDSMVQRFEYCTDLLWKLIKVYLEEFEKVTLESVSPRGVIRDAVKTRLISEQDGTLCLTMINKRNETSHIYHEEVAIDIARSLPDFYQLMERIVAAIKSKSGN
jgi:nucleotidyltransferase substrate binding protein (TIGR01987 family)